MEISAIEKKNHSSQCD